MIDEVDAQLTAWVQTVTPGVTVAIDRLPGAGATGDVFLQLIELREVPRARGGARPPLQVVLTYLLTTGGEDVTLAHKRLGDLLFAALEHQDYEVRPASIQSAVWLAAATVPRPGFLLSVPLRKPREQAVAKPVLEALRVRGTAARPLAGVVLGPRDMPIADAIVELPLLQLSTRSDHAGRFRFAAVPADPPNQQIRVRAKAREFPFSIASVDADEPVALRIDPTRG
jgi:hypothetical protein